MKPTLLWCCLGLAAASPPFGFQPRSPPSPSQVESVDVLHLVDAARNLAKANKLATEKVLMKIFPVLERIFDADGDGRWSVVGDHTTNYFRLSRYWAVSLNRPIPVSLPQWLAMDRAGDGLIGYGDLAAVIVDEPDSDLWTAAMSGFFSRAADFDGNGRVERGELMHLLQRTVQQEELGQDSLPAFLQVMPPGKARSQAAPLPAAGPGPARPKIFAPAAPQPSQPRPFASPPKRMMKNKSQPFPVLMKIQKLQRKIAGSPDEARTILRRGWGQIKPLLDMNNDGRLRTFDLEGLWAKTNAYWQIYLEPSAGMAFPDKGAWLRFLDPDHDGNFSQAEFERAMVEEVRGSLWENFAAVLFMAKFDTAPQDGLILPNEIRIIQTTPIRHIFEQL